MLSERSNKLAGLLLTLQDNVNKIIAEEKPLHEEALNIEKRLTLAEKFIKSKRLANEFKAYLQANGNPLYAEEFER